LAEIWLKLSFRTLLLDVHTLEFVNFVGSLEYDTPLFETVILSGVL
jgi:hypothetical protein